MELAILSPTEIQNSQIHVWKRPKCLRTANYKDSHFEHKKKIFELKRGPNTSNIEKMQLELLGRDQRCWGLRIIEGRIIENWGCILSDLTAIYNSAIYFNKNCKFINFFHLYNPLFCYFFTLYTFKIYTIHVCDRRIILYK